MVLELNNAHIIYYYMDKTQSVGLLWTYFAHSDYMIIQGWIHATCLYPDTINKTGPHVYHYVKFFLGKVGYTPLSSPCDNIVAIVNHSNAVQSFIVTIYPTIISCPC